MRRRSGTSFAILNLASATQIDGLPLNNRDLQSHIFTMRFFIVLFVIFVVLIIGGWLVIDFRKDATTVEFRTDKMKHDASTVVEKASENLKKAGDAITSP